MGVRDIFEFLRGGDGEREREKAREREREGGDTDK